VGYVGMRPSAVLRDAHCGPFNGSKQTFSDALMGNDIANYRTDALHYGAANVTCSQFNSYSSSFTKRWRYTTYDEGIIAFRREMIVNDHEQGGQQSPSL
jgi:hypothetical protein